MKTLGGARRFGTIPVTPNYYVLNGLVSMWDGEWNAGINRHDSNATIWKDLVGNNDILLIGEYSIKEKNIDFTNGYGESLPGSTMTKFTLEVSCIDYSGNCLVSLSKNLYRWLKITKYYNKYGFGVGNAFSPFQISMSHTFTCTHDMTTFSSYGDGLLLGTINAAYGIGNTQLYVCSDSYATSKSVTGSGKFRCIRLYDRILTADEVQKNYDIDVIRFG